MSKYAVQETFNGFCNVDKTSRVFKLNIHYKNVAAPLNIDYARPTHFTERII